MFSSIYISCSNICWHSLLIDVAKICWLAYIYIYMMRELTLREKQAIWMLKEKRKSVKTVKMNLIDVSVKSPTTWWKCHQTNWEVLHIASEQWPQTPCQLSQGVYKGKEMESLRLPKSISRFKSDWTWVSPAEEESKGRNSQNKQQLELAAVKTGKIFQRMRQGDVYGSQTPCCDCAQGICN